MQIHPANNTSVARLAMLASAAGLVILLGGCSIRESRGENGEAKKVDIVTPFGGIHVNAHDVDPKTTGMAVYPGSTQIQKEHGDESANVSIDSSFFGVKVVALKFRTNDPPDKVLGYYRDQLKTYGNVLECRGTQIDDQHAKPGESRELTCGNESVRVQGVNIQADHDSVQLKVGTTDRQHIVAVKPNGSGSEFSLVYVQTRGKNDSM